MKRTVSVLVSAFLMIAQLTITANVSAAGAKASIPDRMAPDTVIRYDTSTHFVIEHGSYCNAAEQNALNSLLNKKNAFIKNNQSAIDNGSIKLVKNPDPVPGMIVTYDGEGYIKNITPDSTDIITTKGTLHPMYGYAPIGVYYWGAHNNVMDIMNTMVSASGRFTNYTDTYGEQDNVLVKGDVATKGKFDNPPYNTLIYCDNFDDDTEGYNITMYKRDNGSLPDACLDIWKYGVEYFGVQWSPNVSIDNAGYYHDK